MGYGKKFNMNLAAERVAMKLRSGNGWNFHTASKWALSFPPYAGNFTQEEFDQVIGKILNSWKQAKRNAGSKKEKTAKPQVPPASVAMKLNLPSTLATYPD